MMYWYGGGGWHPWVAVLMWVGMILFWALVIFGFVWLIRGSVGSNGGTDHSADPERILQQRLARGEIDIDQYRRRLDTLRGRERVGTG